MGNDSKRVLIALLATSLILSGVSKKANAEASVSETTAIYALSREEIKVTKHIVKKGDTLSGISKKYYGISSYWRELATFNGLSDPNKIYKGQIIKVPNNLEDLLEYVYEFDETEDKTYIVQEGDTLYGICHRFYSVGGNAVIWRLATYNKLYNPNYIRTGQRLLIPSYEELMETKCIDYSSCYPEPKPEHCDHHDHEGHRHGHGRTLTPHFD